MCETKRVFLHIYIVNHPHKIVVVFCLTLKSIVYDLKAYIKLRKRKTMILCCKNNILKV